MTQIRKTTLLSSTCLTVAGLALGLGLGLRATPRVQAETAPAPITPKTQVPRGGALALAGVCRYRAGTAAQRGSSGRRARGAQDSRAPYER